VSSGAFICPAHLSYWGKARPPFDGESRFHRLVYHCLDVAATGNLYVREHPALLQWLGKRAGLDDAAALSWITFWLALHDLGKFATSFQNQRPDLLELLQGRKSAKAYVGVRHDALGELLFRRKLIANADVFGLGTESVRQFRRIAPWLCAVTGHHGEPPHAGTASLEAHFDPRDEAAASAFVEEVRGLLQFDGPLNAFMALPIRDASELGWLCSWWMAGVAVLADWLGSNTDYFPYESRQRTLSDYWQESALPRARRAIEGAGISPASVSKGRRFWDMFPRERLPSLTPLQEWADTQKISAGPQLYLLEDVTGAGKTEAALTLAYRLMEAGLADGIFMGLPTMATANAMYERVSAIAGRLYLPGSRASVVLAHGSRDLLASFRESVLPACSPEGDSKQLDETAGARCQAWFADSNKKALLANVGVGTIDQALLGVLHARHQSLRLLGLFRKVLIVDEVHACDSYMQHLLEGLLQFHAFAGGSAILVSATLTSTMKLRLVRAYAQGCRWPEAGISGRDFPLVTRLDSGGVTEAPVDTRADVRRRVDVMYVSDAGRVREEIRAAVEAGHCVCWVRNTVADAIESCERLRQEMPAVPLMLFHARFTVCDRLAIERDLLARFGPDSKPNQRRGRLVVATQVVEQSLDVDFDLLVSDLAPIDRLIQRSGRLQRHVRDCDGARTSERDGRGGARMVVFGPEWSDAPGSNWIKGFFPRGAAVYPHAGQLWITARELMARGGFSMPDDARELVEMVFDADTDFPESLRRNANEVEGRQWASVNIAHANRLTLESGYRRSDSGKWLADDDSPAMSSEDGWDLGAATREGESSTAVYVGRWDGNWCIPWATGASAWELSVVRVISRHIKEPVCEAHQEEAYESARATLPDQGRWSALLPFAEDGSGAWCAQGRDHRGKIRRWRYDSTTGLRELPAGSDSQAREAVA
jgi:CRISPR-associated endonuclease/helicase Cas3